VAGAGVEAGIDQHPVVAGPTIDPQIASIVVGENAVGACSAEKDIFALLPIHAVPSCSAPQTISAPTTPDRVVSQTTIQPIVSESSGAIACAGSVSEDVVAGAEADPTVHQPCDRDAIVTGPELPQIVALKSCAAHVTGFKQLTTAVDQRAIRIPKLQRIPTHVYPHRICAWRSNKGKGHEIVSTISRPDYHLSPGSRRRCKSKCSGTHDRQHHRQPDTCDGDFGSP
jgi:hypothetical protein